MKGVELRNALKAKKPHFRNHNSHKIKRATNAYRRPKGLQNKMRLNHKSYSRQVSIGFRSPVEARGMTRDGLWPVVVANVKQLAELEAGKHGVVLASGLGMRKRAAIAQEAAKLKLTVINCADPAKYAAKVEKLVIDRHLRREKHKQDQAEAVKKAEKKEKAAEKKEEKKAEKSESTEEAKETEKKELDKVLTKKE